MDDDLDSFTRWYEGLYGRVVGALVVVAGSRAAAEDAAAEAFARAWLRWPRVREMASPDGWVYRVGLNEVRTRSRRVGAERRALRRLGQPAQEPPSPPGLPVEVWEAVASLPARTRSAVALRYVAGLTQQEIAEVMRVAPGTVASALHQGRARLAELLGEESGHG